MALEDLANVKGISCSTDSGKGDPLFTKDPATGPWAVPLSLPHHTVGKRTPAVHQTSLTRYGRRNLDRSPMRPWMRVGTLAAARVRELQRQAKRRRWKSGRSAKSPP